MNGGIRHGGARRIGLAAALWLSAVALRANPISIDELPIVQPGTIIAIILSILCEAVCIFYILRRRRTPPLFILWLMVMHLVTYPLFLGLLWLVDSLHPAAVAAIAEGLIVLIEGSLIYLICRYGPSFKSELPAPSVFGTLLASLAGNICSAVVFPLLISAFPPME